MPPSLNPGPIGLYDPRDEHDACGAGFVADLGGKRSHVIVQRALEALVNLTHRGAIDADARTGDGAGVLTQIPHRLFQRELDGWGFALPRPSDLGVGMAFLPREDKMTRELCRLLVEEALAHNDLRFLGWRDVPIDETVIGDKAALTRPAIQQALFTRPESMPDAEYQRAIYLARKAVERSATRRGIRDFYLPSFSNKTIIYKGLFVAPQLPAFYLDLKNPLFESALAVFHQRYSTNTFPEWRLAHPYRMICHNGEINTLQGNLNWMRSREAELGTDDFANRLRKLMPVVQPGGSDSAALDNALESLVASGRDVLHAITMLIPEAWENNPELSQQVVDYYKYHSCLMEPWDGPAAVVFTDGDVVGATLDRGGLRPSRYKIFADNTMVLGSEVGIVDLPESEVVAKGRLSPGRVLAVDTRGPGLLDNARIKEGLGARRAWSAWLSRQLVEMPPQGSIVRLATILAADANPDDLSLPAQQRLFGYNSEDVRRVLLGMFKEGKEAVGSMGDDTPHAVLSELPKPLHHFFKQRFAQVTNPPIDSIREEVMMSLHVNLGHRLSIFEEETEDHARMLRIQSPILTPGQMRWLMHDAPAEFVPARIPILFDPAAGRAGLEAGLRALCDAAEAAIAAGRKILLLTDGGVSRRMTATPSLLAIGTLHHHLIRCGLRERVSIVAETGDVREVHGAALALGYGASAIYPYLVYEQLYSHFGVPAHVTEDELAAFQGRSSEELGGITLQKAFDNFIGSMEDGLRKIMAKMGISTLASYIGAQIFEAIGLDQDIIDRAFAGTRSSIGGIGLGEVAQNYQEFHHSALSAALNGSLPNEGLFTYTSKGEYHAFNPAVAKSLRQAAKDRYRAGYEEYQKAVNGRPATAIRDLLQIQSDRAPIDVDDVEPAEAIIKRFATAAMSYGSLSQEVHETLAVAMNRVGAKSNSGEGGEDARRYRPRDNGDNANSSVKQVASGRFGVTAEYLVNARIIEIKMAQGSKPGEGGQLPGYKVSAEIAAVRRSTAGVTLISPPPHHDIYSIEDLAQLIHDLKVVNPRAKVCVKLVAEAGVGTVAAGVAKAGAELIHISGHDGGTGASPLSSIKHAGSAWEIGLAEAQQILVLNDLRGRVTLRVDGGLKTGRDVFIAALLGAEEFIFGTAALVSLGCVMARQCHTNKCPVGIATQDPKLRAKFAGMPEHLIHYLLFVAQELRELMAEHGYDSLNDLIGRVDLLSQSRREDCPRSDCIDLAPVLARVDPEGRRKRRGHRERNVRPAEAYLDDTIVQESRDVMTSCRGVRRIALDIRNTHRSVGAGVAGKIAFDRGEAGLGEGRIEATFTGSAGQSFGAFILPGLHLQLEGEANDFVGKSMSGGEIVIRPPRDAGFAAAENVILGNAALYGATGGSLFASGLAGERFAVRNSGATAVVEGVGDHGCEYMTGGLVVVLGETGRNFAAGMTGGIAYVYDRADTFRRRFNRELVSLESVEGAEADALGDLIARHVDLTGSEVGAQILANWESEVLHFRKVLPFEVARLEAEAKIANARGVEATA